MYFHRPIELGSWILGLPAAPWLCRWCLQHQHFFCLPLHLLWLLPASAQPSGPPSYNFCAPPQPLLTHFWGPHRRNQRGRRTRPKREWGAYFFNRRPVTDFEALCGCPFRTRFPHGKLNRFRGGAGHGGQGWGGGPWGGGAEPSAWPGLGLRRGLLPCIITRRPAMWLAYESLQPQLRPELALMMLLLAVFLARLLIPSRGLSARSWPETPGSPQEVLSQIAPISGQI